MIRLAILVILFLLAAAIALVAAAFLATLGRFDDTWVALVLWLLLIKPIFSWLRGS